MRRIDTLREIAAMHNRYVPDDVQLVERNGYIFFVHPRMRYDPITLTVLALTATGIGTAVGIGVSSPEGLLHMVGGSARWVFESFALAGGAADVETIIADGTADVKVGAAYSLFVKAGTAGELKFFGNQTIDVDDLNSHDLGGLGTAYVRVTAAGDLRVEKNAAVADFWGGIQAMWM